MALEISDNGIGIPPELLGKIFDSTRQTTRQGTKGENGTGFGMPIVQSTMKRYQGQVTISSRSIDEFPDAHGTVISLKFNRSEEIPSCQRVA